MTNSTSQKYSDGINLIFCNIPQDVLLQLSTVAVLTALVGGKAFSETLQAISQASEEVFRGDRLPVLQFPSETNAVE